MEDPIPSVETPLERNEETTNPKPALTPPTSEDMDNRKERLSSELSELDSDDDVEDIEPAYYFEGGKIPVFQPTMDQFRSFKKFIEKVNKYGMKSGIVKVIPPAEWRNSLPDLAEAVKTIKVKNPITQEFAGQHGIYTQNNIEKQRSYNLPEWRALTNEPHHQPPARRGERRKAAAEAPKRTRATRAQAASKDADDYSPATKRGPGRPRRRPAKKEEAVEEQEADDEIEVPPTPKSPGKEEPEKKPSRTRVKKEDREGSATPKQRGRQPRSTASRRMNNRTETSNYIDEEAFEDFDYHLPGLEEYTVERCKELEENYWRTINYGQPMYGADMPGSLFDDQTSSWNVAKLENLLDILGTKVPGVNTAYLYLGMWKATFAWHLEDVDLYSINYIHFGAPKQWYSISQEDARRFEAAMKTIWPNDAKNCSQFLRHKTYLISPAQLENKFNIKVNRLVHYEGEFVITYPYGYHSGYNLGYNCAESVNFANESWLEFGKIAKKCECESDSVWVDVGEIQRKLRGEPTPEYYEETDDEDDEGIDHLPSPPPSVAGKPKGKASRKPGNKRKRANEEPKEAPRPKKLKRIRIRIKVPGRGMPCVLCPNDVDFDELLPTDNGLKAHRLCADYTPETFITSKPNETVCNVANIGKDRLELKCNYCRSKRGAVFQCSQKKCTRAFHATCAAAAGVQVDLGPMPTFDEEGTEYFYDGYDFRCRFHRPKKRNLKKVTSDTLDNDKFIMNYAKTLKAKDVVQFQYLDTEMYQIYGGLVIENRPGESTLLIEVLPDSDRIEVEWKYLLALDSVDSERPKPSVNAKPLPEHLQQNDSSLAITNRTDGVPEMGDPFQDPNSEQKWAEFNTAAEVTHKIAKVDLAKPDRLWHYLGKTSTEARPQYTEDPTKPKHNMKSNFLETVKPAPIPIPPMIGRSYPASYPIKPAPVSIPPRTPLQPYIQPADKPYAYKPRTEQAYRAPVSNYSPDTRKNPNSPVAHQPNVVYNHRATPQYGYSPYSNGYHQHRVPVTNTHTFHHYTPPQQPPATTAASNWKPASTSGPLLEGIDRYAQSGQSLPAYPYYQAPPNVPRQIPPFPHAQSPGQRPLYSPSAATTAPPPQVQDLARNMAPPIMSNPAGPSKSPKYASATPSSVYTAQTPLLQSEYLAYVTKYPYLKNAFLRRAQTYISPYSPNGGFTSEWMPKPGSTPASAAPRPSSTNRTPQGLGLNLSGGYQHNLPPPRPSFQFQTPDAFQRDMAKAQSGMPKWESRMMQLAAVPGSTSQPGMTASASAPFLGPPLLPPPRASSLSQDTSKTATPPAKSYTPPLPPPAHLQQPMPSPVSDGLRSPKRPEYSPISDDEKAPAPKPTLAPTAQAHAGETWRYS
ncbi:hypothetical protein K491DRAFT_725165 [Lophiostoma macrostomum CBS 122681]|uniref:[histone H3]-trimethyl-L-lysine(9) demethylase n=1 Tax=Lophiostoma macrostomum CBS 122681 TaxID=1314788 RepID=A0A6A6TND1_9PLEO|nr:hypothetical protein K491DRAFT_725165 [Lophiostoma macrostomum CBS 122681]